MQSQVKCAWRWPGVPRFVFYDDTFMLLQSCLCYSQRHPSEGLIFLPDVGVSPPFPSSLSHSS